MSSISFDRASGYYDATRGYPPGVPARIAEAIANAAGAGAQTRFLELGVGTGRIAMPLLERGYDYTGIDLSEPMLAQMRAKIAAFQAEHPDQPPLRTQLDVGDSTQLPYPDASFDVVLSVHVLHLIPNWQAAISEALRVLVPGGVYLNGSDDDITPSKQRGVSDLWMEILKNLGYDLGKVPMSRAGFATGQRVQDDLSARGLHPERLATATWQATTTPRQALQFIAQRLWSRTWSIPDDLFAESVRQLEAQVQAQFGAAMDAPEARAMQFTILRTRKV